MHGAIKRKKGRSSKPKQIFQMHVVS